MQVGEEKGADEETAFDDSLEFGFSVLVEVLVLLEVAFALGYGQLDKCEGGKLNFPTLSMTRPLVLAMEAKNQQ